MRRAPRATAVPARATRRWWSTCSRAAASAARISATVATGRISARPAPAAALGHHHGHGHGGGMGERDVPAATCRRSASAAAPSASRRVGAPEVGPPPGARTTSTSRRANVPSPLPRAFMTASLAAKRAASRSVGSCERAASARSPTVKSRSASGDGAAGPGGTGRRRRRRRPPPPRRPPGPGGRSFDGHRLGQVPGAVDVVAEQAGQAIGQELQGHHVDHRGEQRLGGGTHSTWSATPPPARPRRRPPAPPWRPGWPPRPRWPSSSRRGGRGWPPRPPRCPAPPGRWARA